MIQTKAVDFVECSGVRRKILWSAIYDDPSALRWTLNSVTNLTELLTTKIAERKHRLHELTGFDVELHHFRAKVIAGIAENFHIGGDLESDHTLSAIFSLCLQCI